MTGSHHRPHNRRAHRPRAGEPFALETASRSSPVRHLPGARRGIGQVVTGPVTKIVPFGVFIRIEDREDGFEGLVHTGELDQSLQDVIEAGDARTVKIMEIDLARRRIALSQRQADR
ncbi:S1 RNA-binding domain-containing protein [Streptomyces sp. NPDC055089]